MKDYDDWDQFQKHVKHNWGKLTHQDLVEIAGVRSRLYEKLEERYGWKMDHAKEEVRQFERKLSHADTKHKKNTNPGKQIP